MEPPTNNKRGPRTLNASQPAAPQKPGQPNTTYECDTCQQAFDGKIARDEHCAQSYHVRPEHECDGCADYFAHRRHQRWHMRQEGHRRESSGQYECATCGLAFPAGMDARDQHCVVMGHFPPELECCFCTLTFESKALLEEHREKAWHFEFRCRYCVGESKDRFGSDYARQVAAHERKIHLWRCSICEGYPLVPEGCESGFPYIRQADEDLVLVEEHEFMEHGICRECDRVFKGSNKHLKDMVRESPHPKPLSGSFDLTLTLTLTHCIL